MPAIFKRECKAYLTQLYGFAMMALIFCGVNAFLINSLINTQQLRIEYVLYGGSYVLVVAIPLLCMRSMAEDKRDGIDRFYRTLPLRPSTVVLGKFFALVAIFAIPTALLALYPVILGAFGTMQYGNAYLALLYFFLVGVALISVCQFISSLTRHPLLAGGIGLLVSALLFALPFAEYILPDGILLSILENLSPIYHMEDIVQYGILNLRSLTALLAYPVLFVFLTLLVGGARRVGGVVVGVSLLAVVIAVNVILPLLPFRATELNTDRKSLVNIPPETREFLSNVEEDVTIYWLCENNELKDTVLGDWFVRLLDRYAESNPHITVRTITDPKDIKSWEEIDIYNYDLIISSEKRASVVASTEMFGYSCRFINDLNGGQELLYSATDMEQILISLLQSYPEQQEEIQNGLYISCVAHAKLTAALDYVTVEHTPRPYLLTGFGGASLPDGLKKALEAYDPDTLTELDISNVDAIPADAGCILLYAPLADLGERETAILESYLSAGGSLVLATSPTFWSAGGNRLQSLLTPYGLTALSGILFESQSNYYVSSTDTLVPQVNQQHPLYAIYQSNPSHRMPWSHAIGISMNASAIPLFATSSAAIRKPAGGTDETLGSATQYYPAVHAMRTTATGAASQVIWFGSTDAFADTVAVAATANYEYLIESLDLLRGEFVSDYESITGVPVTTAAVQTPSTAQSVGLILLTVTALPSALLAWGVAVWLKRYRRR